MRELKFRNLRPDEIEIRPTDTKTKGSALLLLYQNARCAMAILDETVGTDWQCDYKEVNGNIYCGIGIKMDDEWVWRWDCGSFNAKDDEIQSKADASDAFKRAAVRWQIGRELYYTPKVRIKAPDSYYFNNRFCMTFTVRDIAFEDNVCTKLIVIDKFGNVVYNLDSYQTMAVPAELKAAVANSNDTEELKCVWTSNANWHGNKDFKAMVSDRKREITTN